MRLAQPRPQLVPTAGPHRLVPRRHVPRKVLAARPARVQSRKQAHEAPHVRLLGRRRLGRVRGRDRVQERPAGAAEGFDVGGAVVWDGDGGFWGGCGGGGLFGLRCPGGEGGAASATWGGGGRLVEGCCKRRRKGAYGFPSLPRTTPLGNFFGGSLVVSVGCCCCSPVGRVSSGLSAMLGYAGGESGKCRCKDDGVDVCSFFMRLDCQCRACRKPKLIGLGWLGWLQGLASNLQG